MAKVKITKRRVEMYKLIQLHIYACHDIFFFWYDLLNILIDSYIICTCFVAAIKVANRIYQLESNK